MNDNGKETKIHIKLCHVNLTFLLKCNNKNTCVVCIAYTYHAYNMYKMVCVCTLYMHDGNVNRNKRAHCMTT